MKNPKEKYENRLERYGRLLKKQKRSVNIISNLRLFVAVAAVSSFLFFYLSGNHSTAYMTAGAILLIFMYLVVIHNRAIDFEEYIQGLYKINDISIKRFTDDWKEFEDRGDEFIDENHPFTQDLDIFGRASLFQWINTANTRIGRHALKSALSEPASKITDIKARQDAVGELAGMGWWRQRFAVEGMKVKDKIKDEENLLRWAEDRNALYHNNWLILTVTIMPVITISSLILSYGFHLVPRTAFTILAIVQFGMLYLWVNDRNRALSTVYRYKNEIKLYAKMLRYFEKPRFKSAYLNKLQSGLLNSKGEKASEQIKRLEKIADWISNRENAMFLPINILLLWDYHSMIALEKWKEQSGQNIKKWMETMGEIEALSSLAVIRHDYPHWAVPEFTSMPSVLKAKSLGHPLLGARKVCNDLSIEKPASTLLITGSNMSGKSTYLRTGGINMVLAYAGAPVCASYIKCSIMDIHTCMRVKDNLEKNISSFYAEILRIRDIVNASKGDRQVFFLLDEIFKGTNSHDRHVGAERVIRNLCKNGAVGMASTHDLELGDLEKDSGGQVKNYHFQEYYRDDEIHFDYKLRLGVSTTRNALYLIRMAGIDEGL